MWVDCELKVTTQVLEGEKKNPHRNKCRISNGAPSCRRVSVTVWHLQRICKDKVQFVLSGTSSPDHYESWLGPADVRPHHQPVASTTPSWNLACSAVRDSCGDSFLRRLGVVGANFQNHTHQANPEHSGLQVTFLALGFCEEAGYKGSPCPNVSACGGKGATQKQRGERRMEGRGREGDLRCFADGTTSWTKLSYAPSGQSPNPSPSGDGIFSACWCVI